MKTFLITLGVTSALCVTPLFSDALSNSLNGMLSTKNTSTGMVNLNGLSMNGKPKRTSVKRTFKGRSGKTIIGKYSDNKPVYKRDADKYIRKITKGKVKDLDMLPKKQRLLVLSDLQKVYASKHFKSRSGTAVIGHYNDDTSVYKSEADKYLKDVTKGKITDLDKLPKKQRLLVLDDLQRMYAIKHFKSRSDETVIATVNEQNITKKEADIFLKEVSQGKVDDFDKLDEEQRFVLISDLVRPMLARDAIEDDLSEEEKDEVLKQAWLEKAKKSIDVLPDEMLDLYERKKVKTLAENPQAPIPPYISLGESLKNEIIEQKVMAMVMKDINITINYDTKEIE